MSQPQAKLTRPPANQQQQQHPIKSPTSLGSGASTVKETFSSIKKGNGLAFKDLTRYAVSKNVLPQMTKRVLSSKKIILCRSPPVIVNTPVATFVSNDQPQQHSTPLRRGEESSKSNPNQVLSDLDQPAMMMTNHKYQQKHNFEFSPQQTQKKMSNTTIQQSSLQQTSQSTGEYQFLLKFQTIDAQLQATSYRARTGYSKGVNQHNSKIFLQHRRSSDTTAAQEITQSFDAFPNNKESSQTYVKKTAAQVEPKRIFRKTQVKQQSKVSTYLGDSSLAHQVFHQQHQKKQQQQQLSTLNNRHMSITSKLKGQQRSTSAIKNPKALGLSQNKLQKATSVNDDIQNSEARYSQRINTDQTDQNDQFSPVRFASRKQNRNHIITDSSLSQNFKLNHIKLKSRTNGASATVDQVKSVNSTQFQNYSVNTMDNNDQLNLLSPTSAAVAASVDVVSTDYSLPSSVVMLILQYNFDEYPKYLRLSAPWYCCINDALDEYSNCIENTFIQKYTRYLNFLKSYINATPIEFCGRKGVRVDRIFQCEVADHPKVTNQTLRIAYLNEYVKKESGGAGSSLQSMRYQTEYRFDVVKKGTKRITWIHMSDDMPPCSQNEIQVSPGDIIEFAVCLFNMNGIVDLSTLEWDTPAVLPIPATERDPLSYNRDLRLLQNKNDRKTKVHCNINRICEIEDAVPEWIKLGPLLRDQPRLAINTSHFEKRFNVLAVNFNELDIHFNKLVLQAHRRGTVEEQVFGSSLVVQVRGEHEPIVNEIRKRGVIFDRNKEKERIQARVGDIIVVYNSVKIPDDLQQEPLSQYTSRISSVNNQSHRASNYNSGASLAATAVKK